MATKSKTWVFTINNYNDADIELMKAWAEEVGRITASKEVGESGTPHIQGAVTFKNTKTLTAVKKLHTRAHWAIALAADCFLYCLKDDSEVIVNVNNSRQGKRTDLDNAIDDIKANKKLRTVIESNPKVFIKYGGNLERIHRWIYTPSEKTEFKVTWVWGAPGVGKSKYCREKAGPKRIEFTQYDHFRGYTDQENVIFSDLRVSSLSWELLLNLLDKHWIGYVPCFGATYLWNASNIYINCPMSPQSFCAMKTEEDANQLFRRINEIIHLTISEVQPGIELE